jgi:hypothetical protein
MHNSFLPKGYEAPKSSGNYFKFEEGDNRFRVLSSAIVGWMYWTLDNKPVRSRTPFKEVPANARLKEIKDNDGNLVREVFAPQHFWAFVVWNYDEEKVQIMEIVQGTIQEPIEALVSNPKWGAPQGYDLVVKAIGKGLNRKYQVVPEPHSEAPKVDISNIYLEELYTGGDPFNAKTTDGKPMPSFDRSPEEVSVVPEAADEGAGQEATIN